MANRPRPVVHLILRRHGKLLLQRIVDGATGEVAWRAPGGGIEWRESAEAAARREAREELGVELASLRQLGAVDGLITLNGIEEHEVVFLFEATPVSWDELEANLAGAAEADGKPLDVRWVAATELVAAGERLYPAGMAEFVLGLKGRRIRAVALCVFRRGNEVLVFEGWDAVKQRRFRRFPGGGIEFGETSAEAVRREMREELETELGDLRLLGVLDNIFQFEGQPGHEVVFVFEAAFPDASHYETLDQFRLADDGGWVDVAWVAISDLADPAAPLVPEAALALLQSQG